MLTFGNNALVVMTDRDFQIYLASSSPRRAELLRQIGVRFQLVHGEVVEQKDASESPAEYVLRLAQAKATAGWGSLDSRTRRPVLGADTEVVLGDEVFGKPRDREHALEMLRRLSGKTHLVISAVALRSGERVSVKMSQSEVRFRALSELEIEQYWSTGEPSGKAGAYAIQGLGAVFISHLSGSYSGVMGLPVFETAQLLNEFNISIFQ